MDPTQAGEFADALEALGKALRMQLSGSNIQHAEAVTPADGTDLAGVATHGSASSLYVGTTGAVTITTSAGDVAFASLAAGVWHPMPPFTRVKSTGTDASDLVAGF